MSRALVVLDTEFQRRRAADWCWSLKHGTRVEFKAPKRSDDQNAKMWAMLTEVSTQLKWHGMKLTPDDWKLQFLDALRRSKQEELRIVPNIDSTGFVNLSASSSDLSKEEMSDLIELIFKFGAEHDIKFHETSDAPPSSGEGSDGNPEPHAPPVAAPLSADEADNGEAGEHEAADSQSAAPASPPNEAAMVNSARMMATDALKAEMVKKLLQLAGDQAVTPQERLETLDGMRQVWIDKMPGFPGVVSQVFATAAKIVKGELKPDAGRKFMEGLL